MFSVVQRGNWGKIENQDARPRKFPKCPITCSALSSIGMMAIGYFGENTVAGLCGIAIGIGTLAIGSSLYAKAKKVEGTYTIISCNLKKHEVITEEQKKAFQKACTQFRNSDLLLFQNVADFLQEILPPEFSSFTYHQHCLVAWHRDTFSKIGHAHLHYPTIIDPSTITLLKDNITGTILCIGSAEMTSFPLYKIEQEENIQRKNDLLRAAVWFNGNCQLRYDLETMETVSVLADLCIYAGVDCTGEQGASRRTVLNNYHYFNDPNNPHIFVKNGISVRADIENIEFNISSSDLTPFGALVSYSYLKI